MIVSKINEDAKLTYKINSNINTLDSTLRLNLGAFKCNDIIHINICKNIYGSLVIGIIPSFTKKYIAQIDIPTRKYETAIIIDTETYGEQEILTDVLFNIENVTLTL